MVIVQDFCSTNTTKDIKADQPFCNKIEILHLIFEEYNAEEMLMQMMNSFESQAENGDKEWSL